MTKIVDKARRALVRDAAQAVARKANLATKAFRKAAGVIRGFEKLAQEEGLDFSFEAVPERDAVLIRTNIKAAAALGTRGVYVRVTPDGKMHASAGDYFAGLSLEARGPFAAQKIVQYVAKQALTRERLAVKKGLVP